MSKIKIVTDSTMDMTIEQADQLGVVVVPLSVTINGETYLDRVEIQPAEFMETMKGLKDLPKSSQPSAGTFLEVYDKLGEEGYEVISIHMTGKMSGTVRSAESAAQMTKTKVTVVDSEFISIALQFQVREAAEMAKQGKSLEEILGRLDSVRQNSKLYIMIDTLENMVKGGRIGKGRAFIGSLLNIKPIASLEGAEYNPVAKVRSHSQVVKWLAKQFAEDVKGKTVKRVGIVHAEALELAVKLKDSIIELTGYDDIFVDYTGPTISTHTGPGTIAIMYYFE
ncbi:DegV family protein [Bacillus sp. EB106-08-02-XG196]|jgi:DegV family protein with EDD domain|uniref:DegV family protein n=1 Tax=Bacillus sp. EB106-08-02-XG196 TaxID=2737049 RepID=UPI0015C4D2B5|nr:DegV family protein [Bacillus sp. EB106-08-02-XG196]NWQ42177.1 DegV family protein [Bacillus sp. EB106-08-02-XG196]